MKYEPVRNFIDGTFQNATARKYLEIISPLDGNILSEVPMSSSKDLDNAVNAGKKAFQTWSKTPIKERVQVFFRYKYLLEKNLQELAELCSVKKMEKRLVKQLQKLKNVLSLLNLPVHYRNWLQVKS